MGPEETAGPPGNPGAGVGRTGWRAPGSSPSSDRLRVTLRSSEHSEAAPGPSPQDAHELPPGMESGRRGGPSIEEGEAGPGQCLWGVPADKPVLGAGEA